MLLALNLLISNCVRAFNVVVVVGGQEDEQRLASEAPKCLTTRSLAPRMNL